MKEKAKNTSRFEQINKKSSLTKLELISCNDSIKIREIRFRGTYYLLPNQYDGKLENMQKYYVILSSRRKKSRYKKNRDDMVEVYLWETVTQTLTSELYRRAGNDRNARTVCNR